MKKMYTNDEKIKHYQARIKKFEEYIANLKQLNPDDYTGQNWKSELTKQLDESRLRDLVAAAVAQAMAKPSNG